jgi:general stress protein 26
VDHLFETPDASQFGMVSVARCDVSRGLVHGLSFTCRLLNSLQSPAANFRKEVESSSDRAGQSSKHRDSEPRAAEFLARRSPKLAVRRQGRHRLVKEEPTVQEPWTDEFQVKGQSEIVGEVCRANENAHTRCSIGGTMSVPSTKIDRRYSSGDATAVEWKETLREINAAELFWVTTVRVDGRPHVTPVVAAWAEDAIWFSTGTEEQKCANLRSNPHVVLTTGCNRWDSGLDVVIEGDAIHVTDEDVLGRISRAFSNKWDGRWRFVVREEGFCPPWGDGVASVFSVIPDRVFAHSKGDPFGATTHRFQRGCQRP